ncbi:hypothetical protein ERX37_05410 [Macrococcus hajekii]|uniref:Uncharacterized protein n=1 Tax=Macrococcus hajekii TaxID=198482 RepID=A0A4R6BNS3_9STAP|nr:hypothetical protein [Macrococcus hajekii]TDM03523.1 hypothetical protein ERX37_05410 [Macrococcus hajekii]GGA99520.1 hypothetical protein GCM10007190_04480 [Macrococcus hajekii]
MRLSYDYEDLIHELHADVEEGLVDGNDVVRVERGNTIVIGHKSYAPVVDYFYDTDNIEQLEEVDQERIQTIKVNELMIEMLKMNSII